MLVFLGQLLLLLVDIVMASEDQFNSGIFRINPDKIDTKLDGYNIRTFEKISPRMCFDKCLRRPKCHSYNYNRHILRCELNFRPKCVSGIDFHNEVGFVYVDVGHYRGDPMYDTCLGNPCKSGEICENKKDGGVVCVKDQEEIREYVPEDCTQLRKCKNETGVYKVYLSKSDNGLDVFCNMTNGGWTVIQRRKDGSENFRRTWVEYENGFGDLQNEFWLGNKYLNLLTSSGLYKLRVELVDTNGIMYFAEYSTFAVGDATSRYILTINGYSGNAGNYMSYNNGYPFSTYDRDYDSWNDNCADSDGAWWHVSCSYIHLNQDYIKQLRWYPDYFIKSEMMIQRTT
ncbi:fibrinogen-like protein A [Mytilus edulis]|uniref:fibrinogen-like protein A n=1 Tax=Mytilus edulis TaxID=6550 RepID=UPI0039F02274